MLTMTAGDVTTTSHVGFIHSRHMDLEFATTVKDLIILLNNANII